MNDYSKILYKYEKYFSKIHLITDNNEIDNVQIGFFSSNLQSQVQNNNIIK